MTIPSSNTLNGRILRLMIDGKQRSRLEIRQALGVHPDTEVTARIRDLRKPHNGGVIMTCWNEANENGKQVYFYRLAWAPQAVREALANERVAA